MRILLTGGAGYVGSACFRAMRRQGIEAFVYDDLSEGHACAVEAARLVRGRIHDSDLLTETLQRLSIDAVVHFAAKTSVPGSLKDPRGYWHTNVDGTRSLLDSMQDAGCKRVVFSSTAAVYDQGYDRPIRETDSLRPATPYGTSKLAAEHLLAGYAEAYGFAATALRYFNAAGADLDAQNGEAHREETHVIPLVLQAALGHRQSFDLFGDDWDTADGSCERDFVSVLDLAQAHIRALGVQQEGQFEALNLGTGRGTSVRALLDAARRVTGRTVPSQVRERRPGDPAILVADASKARRTLGWTPVHSTPEALLSTAYAWHGQGGFEKYRWQSRLKDAA